MKNANILSFIEEKTKEAEDNVALGTRTSLGWAELTYKGLGVLARKAGSYLIQSGLNKGDRVAIISESMPEFGAAIFGMVLAGVTIVPLDVKLTIHEYNHILSDCMPRAIFTSETYLETAKKIKEIIPSIEQIIVLDGKKEKAEHVNLYAIETKECKWRHQRLDKTALICYTSGTTGNPKGVEITYKNMLSQVMAIGECFNFGKNDSMLSFLPMNHLYEISVGFLSFLSKGASIYYSRSLKPKDLLSVMQTKKIAFMATVPSFLKLLKSTLETEIRQYGPFKKAFYEFKYNIAKTINNPIVSKMLFTELRRKFGPNFKGFMSGGAPLEHDVARFFETIGITIYEAYGLSEASPIVSMNRIGHRRLGSVGKPIPGVKVRIDSETKELQVMGPNIMKGYYNKPEMTKDALTEDGWLKTGDIAKISSHGYIYITGRLKNLIVLAGGKKVFPEEVEAVIETSEFIKEVCVLSTVRQSGEKKGTEEVTAVLVAKDSYYEQYDEKTVEALVLEDVKKKILRVTQYKRPTNIIVRREELPKTTTRKVKRREVKELIEAI